MYWKTGENTTIPQHFPTSPQIEKYIILPQFRSKILCSHCSAAKKLFYHNSAAKNYFPLFRSKKFIFPQFRSKFFIFPQFRSKSQYS
jgi:hypothetical protein